MATIIVGAYMVRYPLGGNLSWALQYLTGLKDLGHDVYVVEKYVHADSCYDPVQQVMTDDCRYGVSVVGELLKRFGLGDHWCFVGAGEVYHGLSKTKIEEVFRRADLFIENGSHGVWNEELALSKAKRIYIDVDPAFTQINLFHKQRRGDVIPAFDHYFTNGWNVGKPDNVIPTCGIDWKYIFNPVNTRLFRTTTPPEDASYSTIMNWKSYVEQAKYNGIEYGHKDMEFEKFIDLPEHVVPGMEVAIASAPRRKHEVLAAHGWQLNNAQQVTFTYDSFLDYLATSKGEFSVVKNMYAATCSGWFSDKSAAFLASGRPVVLQETGFSQYLPVGEGLFAVNNVQEAKEAIETIESNYARHSAIAMEIAFEYLDTRKVLGRVLTEIGI
jgi:hypothetical protein